MIAQSYKRRTSGTISCYGRFKSNNSLRFKRGHWYLLIFAVKNGSPTLCYPTTKPYFKWDNVDKEWELKSIKSVQKALKEAQAKKPTKPAVSVKIGTDERITTFPWQRSQQENQRKNGSQEAS